LSRWRLPPAALHAFMLLSDLRHAVRQLKSHPGYSALSVAGLATGLACCLLIALFVIDELSFDTTHPEVERLYRVEQDWQAGPDGDLQRTAAIQAPVADLLRPEIPGIEAIVRVTSADSPVVTAGDLRFKEDRFLYAEPAFFELFDVDLISGDARALSRPQTLILSEPTAVTIFGEGDPIGREVEIRIDPRSPAETFEVVGVMAEMPRALHLRGDIVASFASTLNAEDAQQWFQTASTYVRLREGVDAPQTAASITAAVTRQSASGEQTAFDAETHLLPVTDIHLRSTATNEIVPQGDIRYVWLFSAIALVVLLIAGINYMNLATARGARRSQEIGVRKAIGAGTGQLVRQFLSESFVVTGLSLVLALAIVALALPGFGQWMSRPLALPVGEPGFWAALLGITVVLSVGAGSYPALVLSAAAPTSSLSGSARTASRTLTRKVLVVGQFVATVVLIACTLGIMRQLHFVQNARLGFTPDQTLVIEAGSALASGDEAFRQAAEQIPGVEQVSLGSAAPGLPAGIRFFPAAEVEGQDDADGGMVIFEWVKADAAFVDVLDLQLATGRSFSPDRPSDVGRSVILNEAAVETLGWADPVGKTMGTGEGQVEVIGVVEDFHFADMRTEIGPLLIEYDPAARDYAMVKLRSEDLPETLAGVESLWGTVAPDYLFDAFFLDDHFAAMYRAERLVGQMFLAFSLLAVLVACLGLFGLAMLAAEQRTKEIGIRKVLGASVASLVGLLSRESAALVCVAFVIGAPLAYLFLRDWLSVFVYRAELSAGLFLLAGGLTVTIALGTVSVQALRAATADPIRALRAE
ncbi:MAG: ABC transporter permease, partial [Bacteroidota bacterium]